MPKKSLKLIPGHYVVNAIIDLLQGNIRLYGPDIAVTIVYYDSELNCVKIFGNHKKFVLFCTAKNTFYFLNFQDMNRKQ